MTDRTQPKGRLTLAAPPRRAIGLPPPAGEAVVTPAPRGPRGLFGMDHRKRKIDLAKQQQKQPKQPTKKQRTAEEQEALRLLKIERAAATEKMHRLAHKEAIKRRVATRDANLARLAVEYPALFDPLHPVPLAKGIDKAVKHATGLSWDDTYAALKHWCGEPAYLRRMIEGGTRVHLDGTPADEIAPREIEDARKRLDAELAKRAAHEAVMAEHAERREAHAQRVAVIQARDARRREKRIAKAARRAERRAAEAAATSGAEQAA